MTQGNDPFSMYPVMCSGFKYSFGSLGGKSYQNACQTLCWSTHHLMWLSVKRDIIVLAKFLKIFVPISQRNESGKVMNQLFKVRT